MQNPIIMLRRSVFILCCTLALHVTSFSQINSLKFTRLNTSNGLSQNSVFAIEKDYKGFMWFGTYEGLNKYDGYKFTVYKHSPENAASISGNSIFSVKEDIDHNLWVLTQHGLDQFDRATETFKHYFTEQEWEVGNNIFQDNKKRIWLSTPHGFCLFDVATGKYKFYKNNPVDSNSLSENYVYKITEDNYGELWISTRNGLNRFDPATEKFTRYKNEPGNIKSIGSGFIKTVYKDSKGNIWAGTQGNGIALFNRKDNSFTNYKHDPENRNSIIYNDILSFTEDAAGKLWIVQKMAVSVYLIIQKIVLLTINMMNITLTAFPVIPCTVCIKIILTIFGPLPGLAELIFCHYLAISLHIIKKVRVTAIV